MDELTEELSDFLEVENGSQGSLGLTRSVAPCKEFCKIALNGRFHHKVVYDLELCLRNLKVRIHGKLL